MSATFLPKISSCKSEDVLTGSQNRFSTSQKVKHSETKSLLPFVASFPSLFLPSSQSCLLWFGLSPPFCPGLSTADRVQEVFSSGARVIALMCVPTRWPSHPYDVSHICMYATKDVQKIKLVCSL